MKKLTPSKMLSSMALATLLVAAAGTTSAQAATFDYTAPNGGQLGGVDMTTNPQNLLGDIEINGTFNKTVTNIPTPSNDGSYLIVTMPISMNYVYDADNDTLAGSQGVIENLSVKVENSGQTTTAQPIKMRLVGLDAKNSNPNLPVKFVTTHDVTDTTNIQVPLQLTLSGPSISTPIFYPFSTISANTTGEINIAAGTNVNMKIEQIQGEKVQNTHLITQGTTVAKHDLKFEFEYAGN